MTPTFKDFNLAPEIQKAIDVLGFTEPTEIQHKAIPLLLAANKVDFHGQAQTGTGKTLAFGIPLLHRINRESKATQALIVAPTRELALQICDSMKPLARAMGISIDTIYGGMSMEEQIRSLKRGVQIVVGTPGRLNDHLRRGALSLKTITTLVLDEADIMLDMGFKEEVDEILQYAPKDREIWLFSATVKSGISTLMAQHMKDPQSVRVSRKNIGTASTKQSFCVVPMRSRLNALCRFIECAPEFYAFIFCQTKILTSEIAEQLARRGYNVGALHGDLSQSQRNMVIKKFKEKAITIVVATDVAARGIDIANLTHVINYSLPEDHESYVHRVGRTGRAGKDGISITFINKGEVRLIQMIQRKFTVEVLPIDVPSRDAIIKGRIEQATHYLTKISESAVEDSTHGEIKTMLTQFTERQLRSMIMQVVHEKFLKSILQEEEMSYAPAARTSAPTDSRFQELLLAIGSDDGVETPDVVGFLTETGSITENQIQKIRIIKRRTFIEVPTEIASVLIDTLRNSSLAGRKTRISLVEEDRSDRGSSDRSSSDNGSFRGGRRRDGGQRYGGYSENRRSNNNDRGAERRRY